MRTVVYCSRASDSARLLAKTLRGMGLRAVRLRRLDRLRDDDYVINWGQRGVGSLPYAGLNHSIPRNKYEELLALSESDVPVPAHSLFAMEGFLGRTLHHSKGGDFLVGCSPDYYVERLDITEEWRFFVFNGLIIRRAVKVRLHGEDDGPFPVRSHDNGWGMSYSLDRDPPRGARDLAKRACAALGLGFAAVDVAVLSDGSMVVLEVNTAPGFDENGGTVQKLATAILQHVGSLCV